LRREEKIYEKDVAASAFNSFDTQRAKYVAVPDIYKSASAFMSLHNKQVIRKALDRAIRNADRVIIRSLGNFYTNTAVKLSQKYKKPYLVEVTGFIFEGYWSHDIKGKFFAPFEEITYRRLIRNAPYVCYVTNATLQKRYPTKLGQSIGCSDVEIEDVDEKVLIQRLSRSAEERPLVIGTAGGINTKVKGQKFVIRALSELKREGHSNYRYELIGRGNPESLLLEAKRRGVDEQVVILGEKKHGDVSGWLDHIDIYVSSSYTEGLSRSVVEAMSHGCPVVCTGVGGNVELCNPRFLCKKFDTKSLAKAIAGISDDSVLRDESQRSFMKAKEFRESILNEKRNRFYSSFIENG
jgi:glycosyltransferase involved in cell wall biosynthesis